MSQLMSIVDLFSAVSHEGQTICVMDRWDKAGGEAVITSPQTRPMLKLAAASSCTPTSGLCCQVLLDAMLLAPRIC